MLSAPMPDRLFTDTIKIDPELIPGARNAIRDCLRLKPEERISIITDEVTRVIAAALDLEFELVGEDHSLFVLEDFAFRPLARLPNIFLHDLTESHASIFF